jgi:hypothetical protein
MEKEMSDLVRNCETLPFLRLKPVHLDDEAVSLIGRFDHPGNAKG